MAQRVVSRWVLSCLAWLLLPGHALSEAAPSVVGADSWPAISLQPTVASGLVDPVYVTHANDGTGRLFVLEQAGRIRIVVKQVLISEPFLDITDRVLSGGERGLLGLAFHPNFRENGRLIVNYTRTPDGATVVSEFRVRHAGERPSLSERILIVIAQPYSNHNGGMIAFGPDGLLYIGMGDGGSAGDPQNRAQNPHELLGKMLRIDVDKNEPYAIPGDNPFRSGGGRPEVYAKGLRNPWRFSFDRETGDLWAADVGQYKWEEIDLVTLNGNYGWRRMEGRHCFIPESGCEGPDLNLPLLEYAHQGGRCSITGGYVYRGQVQSSLKGLYLFGDYCSGELFGARLEGGEHPRAVKGPERLLRTRLRISSFGEDEAGELYVVDHGGGLYHVTETSQTGGEHHNFPANQ